jgi:hypothetical protein
MIILNALTWASTPAYKNPLSTNVFDPAVDTETVYLLLGTYLGVQVAPRFVTVNNYAADQALKFKIDNVEFDVGRFERRTFVLPIGAQRVAVEFITGTATAIDVYISVDDLGYGNGIDAYAVQQTTPGGSAVFFQSANIPLVAAAGGSLAHGLGSFPKSMTVYIINVITQFGYPVGHKLLINPNHYDGSGGLKGCAIVPDAANINYRLANSAGMFGVINWTTGAINNIITNANWELIIEATA